MNNSSKSKKDTLLGKALIHISIKSESEAIELVDEINSIDNEKLKLCLITSYKIESCIWHNTTVLEYMFNNGKEKVAMHILNIIDFDTIKDIYEKLLNYALNSNSYDAYLKICQMGKQNIRIPLYYLCTKSWEKIAVKILDSNENIILFCDNSNRKSALSKACDEGLEELALKILDFSNECFCSYTMTNMDKTELESACYFKLTRVALKMLLYPDKCQLSHHNSIHGNCLQIAASNNMMDVVVAIANAQNNDKFFQLKLIQITEKYEQIKFYENQIILYENTIRNKIKDRVIPSECITCCTKNDIFRCLDCDHVINICNECFTKIGSECIVCRKKITNSRNVYVIS